MERIRYPYQTLKTFCLHWSFFLDNMARRFHDLYLSNIQQSILMMSFWPSSQVYDSLQSQVHYSQQLIPQIHCSHQQVSLLENYYE